MQSDRKSFEIRPVHGGEPTWLFRIAIIVWIALAVALAIKGLASPVKHNSYYAFQAGVKLWWADLNMYRGTYSEFRYGPAFAVAFTPLTNFPMGVGAMLWMVLNAGVFFWSLRVLIRDILPADWTADREAVFLLLSLVASFRGMWSAQTNPLIFACVVAAMSAILRRRWGWAALFLAVPVHIKIWPVAVALLLVACWPRQLAWRFVCAVAAVAALPLVSKSPLVVWQRYHEWYLALMGPMLVRHSYRDMWTVWEFFQNPVDPLAYMVMQASTGLLLLALCLWQRQRVTTPLLLTFILGGWTSWQLSFGPGSERNTFGLIGPITAWAAVACLSNRAIRGRAVVAAAVTLTLLATHGHLERALEPMFPFVTATHPIGVLLLVGWLVFHARHWQREPGETTHGAGPIAAGKWAHAA
jgi:hypothetical protein